MASNTTVQIIIDAVDKTKAAIASAKSGLQNLNESSKNTFADLGVAAAMLAVSAFGKAAIDSADDLSKMAAKTGTSVEALSLLKPIAEQSGVSVESLGKGMAKLSQNMASAASGTGTSGKAFEKLGVSVKTATGQLRPTEEVLMDLADQFKAMPNGAAKSALAMELFGKAGVEMIPFLNQGRDGIKELKTKFKELGLEISTETGAAAEKFNDTLDTIKQALTGIALKIAADALPALQKLADGLVSLAKNGQDFLPVIKTLGELLILALGSRVAIAIGSLVMGVGKLASAFRYATAAGAILAGIRIVELIQDFFKAREDADRYAEAAKKGAAETELLVRAANEISATGATSLKTQLELVALAASKVKEALPTIGTSLDDIGKAAASAGAQIKEALQAEVKRAAETVKALSGAYKQASTDIAAQLKDRTSAIDQSYKDQANAAKNAAQSEAQEIASTTQILVNAERQKLQAIQSAADQMQATWQASYQAAIDLATTAGQAEIQAARDAGTGVEDAERNSTARLEQIQRDFLQQRLTSYDQMAAAYRSTVDKLVAEEQRHLQAARDADEARYNLKLSVEDRIRALMQKGMDAAGQYADRQKQIDEKQSQARAALAAGDFDRAKKLAEESMSLIERNATEVTRSVEEGGKKTTQVIVSQGQASNTAMTDMRESASIADQALASLGAAHTKAGQAAGAGADVAKKALEGVTAEIGTLRTELAKQGQLAVTINTDAARQGITDITNLLAAQALVAKVTADVSTAQASIKALQADADNAALQAKVSADTSQVLKDIEALRSSPALQKVEIPAMVDFSQPYEKLRVFATDLKTSLSAPTENTHTIRANDSAAKAAVRELERNTSSTHTIYVRKVERNATGGMVGAALQRFAEGGQALYQRMSGRISGPGTGTSDSIPAMLSAGEYVIKAASVRRFGQTLFDALNAGVMPAGLPGGLSGAPRAYATGGMVLPDNSSTASSAAGTRDQVDIRLHIGSQTMPLQGSRATAQALAAALRDISRAQ